MDDDTRSTCSNSTASTMSAGSVDISRVKTEVILRFDRPEKRRGTQAKCPKCAFIGPNLWKCHKCQIEFGRNVELIAEANLYAKFRPIIVKAEKPPVPDGDPEDEDQAEMITQPVVPTEPVPPKTHESVSGESLRTGSSTNYGTSAVAQTPAHVNQLKTSSLPDAVVSSPKISTTTVEVPSSTDNQSAAVEKRRESATSNSSSSSYKSYGKSHRSERSQKRWDSRVNVEKRIRIFQRTSQRSLERSVLNSAPVFSENRCRLDAQVNLDDFVLEETRVDGKPKIIRLLRAPPKAFGLDVILKSEEYPKDVDKVIFGTPCSLQLVQQVLSFFKAVTAIRFGQNALNVSRDDNPRSLDRSKLKNRRIKSFELTFDRKNYIELNRTDKEIVTSKILEVLKLAQECFVNLEECNITIPYTSDTNRALDKLVSRCRNQGEKTIKYGQNIIQYLLSKVDLEPANNNEQKNSSSSVLNEFGSRSTHKSHGDCPTEKKSNSEDVRPRSTTTSSDTTTCGSILDDIMNVQVKKEDTGAISTATKSPVDMIELSSDDDIDEIFKESVESSNLQNNTASASSSKKRNREEDNDGLLIWDNNSTNIPGHAAGCRKCGTMSRDLVRCENCHSVIDKNAPIREVKKQKMEEVAKSRSAESLATSTLKSAIVTCKSISVGDYHVFLKSSDKPHNVMTITADSITFAVPHRQNKQTLVKCEINLKFIQTVITHYGTKLPLIATKTSEAFEDQIRKNIGLSTNKTDGGNYYSYDKGALCQKLIIFQPEAIAPLVVPRIKEFLGDKLNEISYEKAVDVMKHAECKCDVKK